MSEGRKHLFGGRWTEEKLDCLENYLKAYLLVLKNQPFRKVYIDAFSGTGARYEREKSDTSPTGRLIEVSDEQAGFFEGSVLRALRLDPGFDNFALIEKDPIKAAELHKIKEAHETPDRRINVYVGDANEQIKKICTVADWRGKRTKTQTRAVLFLDPYGCQVEWSTLEAISATGAIDMWYLFPSGLGIYRMLTSEQSRMADAWERRLDLCLGTEEWRTAFFQEFTSTDLFGQVTTERIKTATIDSVERFFVNRLKILFPHVSDRCLPLRNSTGYKMFSLCFASANTGRGGKHAVSIASHLLDEGKRRRR